MKKKLDNKLQISKETISHFRCGSCNKWWSIGDLPRGKAGVPKGKKVWFCPWCGQKH